MVKVKNTHVVNGVQMSVDGTAKFADDAKNAAKFVVALKFGGKATLSSVFLFVDKDFL